MMIEIIAHIVLLLAMKQISATTYNCDPTVSCGCSTGSATVSRIINGEPAANNTWGWIVSLLMNQSRACGGSLISSTWILTAAHCVYGMNPRDIYISAASTIVFQWTQWRQAANLIIHADYDPQTITNDIALIQVDTPFDMSTPSMAKLCLPMFTTIDYPPQDTPLVLIGWGQTSLNSSLSSTLQQVTLFRIPFTNSRCYALIADSSSQICAGVPNSTKDACHGDSGGPLMLFAPSRQWVIIGIVSYGYQCADPDYSTIFTRVTFFINWILSMNVTGYDIIDPMLTTTTTSLSTTSTYRDVHSTNSRSSILIVDSYWWILLLMRIGLNE